MCFNVKKNNKEQWWWHSVAAKENTIKTTDDNKCKKIKNCMSDKNNFDANWNFHFTVAIAMLPPPVSFNNLWCLLRASQWLKSSKSVPHIGVCVCVIKLLFFAFNHVKISYLKSMHCTNWVALVRTNALQHAPLRSRLQQSFRDSTQIFFALHCNF